MLGGEIILSIHAGLHDLRSAATANHPALDREKHPSSQSLASALRSAGSDGLVYPSLRHKGGECAGLSYPDCAADPIQGRHLDYHWNGARADLVRDAGSGAVFRVADLP